MYPFYYRDPAEMTLDPTLCSISKERASSLISQALVGIKTKIEEHEEEKKKDEDAYINSLNISAENAWADKVSLNISAENAWADKVNEYIKERNGIKGSFFKRNWRKLLIFLNIASLTTDYDEFQHMVKISKSNFIKGYIFSMSDHSYHSWSDNLPFHYDLRRLMELKDAVEKSDSIGLSISDMNMISKYGEIK